MGGGRSSLVIDQEMMNVSDFNHNVTKDRTYEPVMHPTNTDDLQVSERKTVLARGHINHCNGAQTGRDVMKRSFTPDSLSPDSLSHSSQGSSHSIGLDAVSTLDQSPSPFHSTPKKCDVKLSKRNDLSGPSAKCNGSHGDSGTESLGNRLCSCDGNNSSCEIIVTKHESVVAKKLLNSSCRRSRSLSDAVLLQREQQKPRWKIEVDMECTRVIYGSLERDANVSIDTQKDMKDESTETDNGKEYLYSDEDDGGEYLVNSISESEDDMKKKKYFWTRKKKRKLTLEKNYSKAATSDDGSTTLKHKHFWPFLKTDPSRGIGTGHPFTPKRELEMKQSTYEEKLKYLHIAARVRSPRAADVRATLLVQTPANKLSNAQLSTKTYLLSVTLNAFFYPYPETYVEWIESLSEIIEQRVERGDIIPKFAESQIHECKVCLIVTPDAAILLGKPNSALIHDLANIAGYSPKNIFVMEVTEGCSTPEKFAPICELEEFEESALEDDAISNENGTQM